MSSIIYWTIIILVLLINYSTRHDDHLIILNSRFLIFLMSALFLTAAFYLQRNNRKLWILGFAALFLIILATLFESHDIFISNRQVRLLSYSFIIFTYAIIFIVPGFKYSNPPLRFTGLSLIGIVIIKFYLYDIWVLKTIIRIIAGFTLGTCLILTAIFYQKFKEKVLNIMFSKNILFILITIFLTASANAEPVRTKSFKYYRDVVINQKQYNNQIYGVIHLDEDFYKYTSGYDLRVVMGKVGLPYFLTEYKIKTKKGHKQPKIIFEKKTGKYSTYVIELPQIPTDSEYTELHIKPAIAGNYEINLELSASKDPTSWVGMGNHFLYKYSNASKKNILNFNLQSKRFVRIKTKSKIKLKFPKASFLPKQKKEYVYNVPMDQVIKAYNSDRKASVFYFNNENGRRINRITLKFAEDRFSRKFEIQIKEAKKYRHFTKGLVVQHKQTKQVINLPFTTNAPLKIFIMNEDNRELTLESFTITGLKEVCIFEFPEKYDGSPIRLYYGNKYMQSPKYDITATHDDALESVKVKTGKHFNNKDFSYSVLEPPVSSWIIRILFACSLMGLLYPSFKIMKRYVEDVGQGQ